MKAQAKTFFDVENVGMFDSVLRASLSVAIVLSVLLIPEISSAGLVILTFAAIYAGLTGFLGWDPLYAWVKGPRHETSTKHEAAAAGSKTVEQGADDIQHKKAA